jgi:putative selenium metabolism hydrolase
MMERALAIAKSYENDIIDFMSRIIQAKSYSGQEKEVVRVISEEMKKVGFDEVFTDDLGNVFGRIGNGKTVIAMDAHIDTVEVGNPELWTKDPFSGEYDGEWVYGRGASDQKAGMVSMVYGMKVLKDLDLLDDFTVYVVGSVMEENCDGLCWQYIVKEDKLKPDFVVITEPTSLNIYRGHRGRVEFQIKTTGLSAHAASPERGVNAIYKMAKIITEIEKLNDRLKYDPFLGKGTIVVSQIFFKSPSQNAVPDECVIHIDRRLTAGETKESAYAEIRDIFDKLNVDAEIIDLTYPGKGYKGTSYSAEKYFPTWVMKENTDVVQAAKKAYEVVFEEEPKIDKWDFSTNGVATAGIFNIPTVGFGPGDEKYAHAPNEKVRASDLIKAAAFYAAFPKTIVNMINKG